MTPRKKGISLARSEIQQGRIKTTGSRNKNSGMPDCTQEKAKGWPLSANNLAFVLVSVHPYSLGNQSDMPRSIKFNEAIKTEIFFR